MAQGAEKHVVKTLQDDAAAGMTLVGQTIAIIDDDKSILKALGRLLTVSGYRVERYCSADAFLKNVSSTEAACLLVDCQLGESSGLELGRELSAAGFRFPTIFMTGSDNEQFRHEATALGCAGFLRKPFEERQLRESIAKAIPQHSAVRRG
jgi:FixJ family two-component response regulator